MSRRIVPVQTEGGRVLHYDATPPGARVPLVITVRPPERDDPEALRELGELLASWLDEAAPGVAE